MLFLTELHAAEINVGRFTMGLRADGGGQLGHFSLVPSTLLGTTRAGLSALSE